MASCSKCDRELVASEVEAGICYPCTQAPTLADLRAEAEQDRRVAAQTERREIAMLMLTTETYPVGLVITRRIEIITAEAAYGMNLLRDFFAGVRDVVGGPSGAVNKVLRAGRRDVLRRLKEEAYEIGANAVIGVTMHYSNFAGGGLIVTAAGTAVEIEDLPAAADQLSQ